jgi:hypothetical protein
VAGLQSHAPAFEAQARDLWELSVHALRFSQQGRLVSGVDAKTGRQMLQRPYPTPPAQPGKPETREHESIPNGQNIQNGFSLMAVTLG